MIDDRLDALERHATAITDALTITIDHVRALAALNAAIMGTLLDMDREAIREAALARVGEGPEHARARGFIEVLTQDPVAAVADHQAGKSATVADLPGWLQ